MTSTGVILSNSSKNSRLLPLYEWDLYFFHLDFLRLYVNVLSIYNETIFLINPKWTSHGKLYSDPPIVCFGD